MPYLTGSDPGTTTFCREILIPDEDAFIQAVNGALYDLTRPENWEQTSGDLTPDEAADIALTMYTAFVASAC